MVFYYIMVLTLFSFGLFFIIDELLRESGRKLLIEMSKILFDKQKLTNIEFKEMIKEHIDVSVESCPDVNNDYYNRLMKS